MPFDAWLLLVLSVGLGLGIEIAFMLARRRDRVPLGEPDSNSSPGVGG